MAINDAVAAYTGLQNAAASEYKDAWAAAPSAGVGQFGGAGPFSGAQGGLSATTMQTKPMQSTASTMMQTKPLQLAGDDAASMGSAIDALPTTPVAPTSTSPIADSIATIGNFSADSPYVSDVTDAGSVGRQAGRPERMAIDDTMPADEQYRRAWQNEANGYYGNSVDKVAPPPAAPAPAPAPTPTPAPAAPAQSMSDDDRALLDTILRERQQAEYSNRFA